MANSKAISVRIPDNLLALIDAKAEKEYKTIKGTINRSLVILDIVFNYFNTLSNTVQKDLDEPTDNVDLTLSDSVRNSIIQELKNYIDEQATANVTLLQNNLITLSDSVSKIKDFLDHHIEKLDSAEMRVNQTETLINTLSDTVHQLKESLALHPEQINSSIITVSDSVIDFALDKKLDLTEKQIEQINFSLSDSADNVRQSENSLNNCDEKVVLEVDTASDNEEKLSEKSSVVDSNKSGNESIQSSLLNKPPINITYSNGINGAVLSKRLGYKSRSGVINLRKDCKDDNDKFNRLTRVKDPDSIAWEYQEEKNYIVLLVVLLVNY